MISDSLRKLWRGTEQTARPFDRHFIFSSTATTLTVNAIVLRLRNVLAKQFDVFQSIRLRLCGAEFHRAALASEAD